MPFFTQVRVNIFDQFHTKNWFLSLLRYFFDGKIFMKSTFFQPILLSFFSVYPCTYTEIDTTLWNNTFKVSIVRSRRRVTLFAYFILPNSLIHGQHMLYCLTSIWCLARANLSWKSWPHTGQGQGTCVLRCFRRMSERLKVFLHVGHSWPPLPLGVDKGGEGGVAANSINFMVSHISSA